MSHEIRTPLGAIIGFSELLREQNLGKDEREQYLSTIIRNGQGLTRIIDDILDLAKVEAGKLAVEKLKFSLYNLVSEVSDLFSDKAKQKSIYVITNVNDGVPEFVFSDPSRIRQILINLVGNAIKFTTVGGVKININAEALDQHQCKVTIDVKDTGIGLSESQRDGLFIPFAQADISTSRKFGGTGLGLILSRRLANALEGNIVLANSREGAGCTFRFTFLSDLSKDAVATSSTATDAGVPPSTLAIDCLKGLHILLAEDSIDNQFLVRRLLNKYGATIEIANNGEEAIKKANQNHYSLILMDIQMPGVDGYEATKALRAGGYKKPIVALTAHAMAEERMSTSAAGFDYHLTKPLNKRELLQTVLRMAKGQ